MASKFRSTDLKKVKVNDGIWKKYTDLVRNTVLPYQWEALNDRVEDAEPSHSIKNFRIAAGEEKGEFGGWVFQDSDLAKWLEAVGYSLAAFPDPELSKYADEIIDLIGRAQQPDGYLNTYFITKEPDKRWTNLTDCHELYSAGHLIEAAVAYYEGTGKRKFLDLMCRYADHIDAVFGREPGKIRGYGGHEEIELALVKLYRATKNEKYLKLASYFVDERGQEPNYFRQEWEKRGRTSFWQPNQETKLDLEYCQAHIPVRQQKEAVGHAVRAVYLYSAMADIAAENNDAELFSMCKSLWENIVTKKMYITGGIGSTRHGEAFTHNYDLPNDTAYQETCASIGMIFFAHRMLKLELDSCYADVMERSLYNSTISGMAQDGKSFFYVNPLEADPVASVEDPGKTHVKVQRQKWYGCACCPPNLTRLIMSLGSYIYTSDENNVYTHLYIAGEAELEVGSGKVAIEQKTNYPWTGDISLKLKEAPDGKFGLGLRIPGWCRKAQIKVNGEKIDISEIMSKGYAVITRAWKTDDLVELNLEMPVELIDSNPNVRQNAGKAAIQRGPVVYCLEEADNGKNLSALEIDSSSPLEAEYDKDFFGGAVIIKGTAYRDSESGWEGQLYRPHETNTEKFAFKAIPYYLWANRGPGEMQVWTRCK